MTGIGIADSPVTLVSLKDSAGSTGTLTTAPDADGRFAFNVAGLTAPFLLKADSASGPVYGLATQAGATGVNSLTTVIVAATSGSNDPAKSWSDREPRSSGDIERVLRSLQTVLKPLFDLYGITSFSDDSAAVAALLKDVSFVVKGRMVTVTNKATGTIIFTGLLNDLSSGTFTAGNMPAGPSGATPSPCTYTYSDWGTCQADGTQARTVASATPAGCTGTPVVSQSCTYTPPQPAQCQYTYSAWGACQPDSTQTRTVVSSGPAGCTGTPVLSQSCVYVPPPVTCSSFTYSAWGTCQPNNTQTRTVLTSSPQGCTGGSPVTTQSCTYVAPTCSSFTYSAWGTCQPNNTQTRTVLTSSPQGCTGGSPVTTQSCTYVAPTCTSFTYSAWGACQPNNTQTRTVLTSSPQGCSGGSPVTTQSCTYVAACTLATATPSCSTCHSSGSSPYPSSHSGRPLTCATCHGPVNNGTGTPSVGMTATAGTGGSCNLAYPFSGSSTHNNGTVNRGAAQ